MVRSPGVFEKMLKTRTRKFQSVKMVELKRSIVTQLKIYCIPKKC